MYVPLAVHVVHVLVPPAEYFEGVHCSHVFVMFDAMVPGPQYSHTLLSTLLAMYPLVLSQGKHAIAAAPEYFPISQLVHVAALLPLKEPGAQIEQFDDPIAAYVPGEQLSQVVAPTPA